MFNLIANKMIPFLCSKDLLNWTGPMILQANVDLQFSHSIFKCKILYILNSCDFMYFLKQRLIIVVFNWCDFIGVNCY